MMNRENDLEETPIGGPRGLLHRLECRECEVICERLVSPWHCLKTSCRYVYVFEDGDGRYFGCLNKVFAPELDLALFEAALSSGRGGDPFGLLKAVRPPRLECRVVVEQAYPSAEAMCCNPTFFHCPLATEEQGIRLIAAGPRRRDPSDRG